MSNDCSSDLNRWIYSTVFSGGLVMFQPSTIVIYKFGAYGVLLT